MTPPPASACQRSDFEQVAQFYDATWRVTLQPDTVDAWWLKLRRFPLPILQQAVFDLASAPGRPPDIGAIEQRCRTLRDRDLALTTRRTELPAGDTPARQWWRKLTDGQRDQWRDSVRDQLPPVLAAAADRHAAQGEWPPWAETLALVAAHDAYRAHRPHEPAA